MLGQHKDLGEHKMGTVDLNWPKGYFTSYNITVINKTGGVLAGGLQLLRVWLGIGQKVVSNCTVHHLLYILFYHYYYIYFFPIKLYLSIQFLPISSFLPHPIRE